MYELSITVNGLTSCELLPFDGIVILCFADAVKVVFKKYSTVIK